MNLSQQTLRRLPTIKHGLLKGLNYKQIGRKAGVTSRTIDRDIKTWIESGDFETWIKEEWLRLHTQIIHDSPALAYKEISRLVGKMVTRKAEITTEQTITERKEVTFKLEQLSEDERKLLESVARRYIKANNPPEPASLH